MLFGFPISQDSLVEPPNNLFEIRYDESGNRQGGGFRNFGKSRIHWSKAYKSSQIKTLEKFYND